MTSDPGDRRGLRSPEPTPVTLVVNGTARTAPAAPRVTLLDFLRDALGLTGTHAGCEHGVCGACTVLLDGEPVRSCLLFAVMAEGHAVTTIEGLADADGGGVLQQAFRDAHALQCGYCTPGMLLAAAALLARDADPSEAAIRAALGANLCRCTGYVQIVEAVRLAADRLHQRQETGAGNPA